MQKNNQPIIVVGAGIVGCTTAYLLAKEGWRVKLIEAAEGPGLVTSFANGAQLSYSYVEPLATPATLKKIPAMLLDTESPLRLKWTGEWAQIIWGWLFMQACTHKQVEQATQALLKLAFLSRDELNQLQQDEVLSFAYAQLGKLVIYNTLKDVDAAKKQVAFQRTLGCKQVVLNTQACLEREPALVDYAAHIAGGVWTPDEAVGDAKMLCDELVQRLPKMGASVQYGATVENFLITGNHICAVKLKSGEEINASFVVLANGNGASDLGKKLGISLPIYPIKGYSLSLSLKDAEKAPKVSVTDLRRKIVYAPLGQKLRIAGMAELVGNNRELTAHRIEFLKQCAAETFPDACDFSCDTSPWAGLRPATPTSMPIIGRAPRYENLLLNVGHGALGFTLAMGSARLISRQMSGWNGQDFSGCFAYRN